MLKLFPVIFFPCFIFVTPYDIGPHKVETVVERFRFGDFDFVFYSKDANWAEAYTICKATHSRLAVVSTPERAKFLADALSQTKVGFEDIWIGGRFLQDRWRWASTGKTFSRTIKGFPPWLSYPTIRGKHCLSLDRRNHVDPIFVEKRCSISRPFICEEKVTDALSYMPEGGTDIKINDRQYLLYHARVTWEEALSFCKQSGARFATVPDMETATKLATFMKRSRPALENVWIGAKRHYMDWIWVATENLIPNETENVDGFPPWKPDELGDPMKGCVMLDHHPCQNADHRGLSRHLCEEPLFIAEQCDLKKDFVCEVASDDNVVQEKISVITVDEIKFIFYEDPLSWIDAMLTCEEVNMVLATPETDKQWETIVSHMGDLQHEFDHAWIGGRWIPNEWVWLNNRSIPFPQANQTNPPWCHGMDLHTENLDCLNIDRDAHNIAAIYGFNCSIKQRFICQLDAVDAIDSPDRFIKSEFEHQDGAMTHYEADWDCKLNHSYLAIVNNMDLARKLAVTMPRDTLVWLDGMRINTEWRWMKTRERIPDEPDKDGYPPWDTSVISQPGQAMCLAMKVGYQEHPAFVEKPCKEKLNYLCQFERKQLPQPNMQLDFNGIKYYFYQKGMTWDDAMSTCNAGNLFLVNVGNLELANLLAEAMEDQGSKWTAGKQVLPSSWAWVTSGSKIPNEKQYGYPPWPEKNLPTNVSANCLLLDSPNSSPVFTPTNCFETHGFVCIDKIFNYKETEIDVSNVTISLQDMITSISKAKEACFDNGKSVVDFSKVSQPELVKLMKLEDVKSFWVDVIYTKDGKWVNADTMKEFKTNIDFPERTGHAITDPKSCLTLQLVSEETLTLVPSLCSDFSRILCMNVEEAKPVPPKVEKTLNETHTIVAILKTTTIESARLVCNDLGGEVVKPLLLGDAFQFFDTLLPAYKQFWLNAKLVNGTWRWMDDGTPVNFETLPLKLAPTYLNETADNENDNENECLIYDKELAKLDTANCSDKYSTVCEKVTGKCQPKKLLSDSMKWTPEKCTLEPLNPGTVCRASCQMNFNLVGSAIHICSKGKWSTMQEPACRTDKAQADSIIKLRNLPSLMHGSTFWFVLDVGIKRSDFKRCLDFVEGITNSVLLNERRNAGIEMYSYDSKVTDYMEYSNCYFMKTLQKQAATASMSNSLPNYYGALLTAERELREKSFRGGSTIIYFFAMRPDMGSMNKTVVIENLKKMGVTFVIITVGDVINRSQLEEFASNNNQGLLLYSFKTMEGMKVATANLRKKSRVKLATCRQFYYQ